MKQMKIQHLDHQFISNVQEVLSTLLSESLEVKYDSDEIQATARWSLFRTLDNLSAADFVVSILSLLKSDNREVVVSRFTKSSAFAETLQVQKGALELLAERVSDITDEAREGLSPQLVDILSQIKDILESNEVSLVRPCTSAIRSISPSARSQEENVLVDIIPLLLRNAQDQSTATQAMAAISAIVYVTLVSVSVILIGLFCIDLRLVPALYHTSVLSLRHASLLSEGLQRPAMKVSVM